MLDGQETELEIIDHPAAEMSVSITDAMFSSICRERNSVVKNNARQSLSDERSYT